MRRLTKESILRRALAQHVARGGFTVMELLVAGAIGSVIGLIAIGGLSEGMQLFKSNSTEMIARDQGSRAIRRIGADIQQAVTTQIFSTYLGTGGGAGGYGACVILQRSTGTSVAYYRYAPTADPNSGGIYFAANAAGVLNPAADKLLVSGARELEFRRDVNGTIRVGFDIGVFGYPTRVAGGKEADLVRFTTSSLPRN